jgi:hypothetical protein
MKKKIIIITTLIIISASIYTAEKYTLYFTDIRYNINKRKFYFMKWDMISAKQANSRNRFVQGNFQGKYLLSVIKYYKGVKQEIMYFDKNSVCRKIIKFKKGRKKYALFYNSGGFVPIASNKKNLIKKITYKHGVPSTMTIYDGYGRKRAVRKLR